MISVLRSLILGLSLILTSLTLLAADHDAGDYSDLKTGDVAKAKIKHLRVLQAAVGFREVDRKADKLEDKDHEQIEAYKIKNSVPVYIDWLGRPRPWDHNHESAALRQAGYKSVWIVVSGNYAKADKEFWKNLAQTQGIVLLNKKGKPLDTTLLPKKFIKLSDADRWQDLIDEKKIQVVDQDGREIAPHVIAEKIAKQAETDFWNQMTALKKVNPYDGDGRVIDPHELDNLKIKDFANDPYRSLGGVVERETGIGNLGVAMEQFVVGRFLKAKGIRFDDESDESFDLAVKKSARLLLSSQSAPLWQKLGVQNPVCRSLFSRKAKD